MGFNRVILQGNLGADPEMRYTANGMAMTTFRVAVGDFYNDREGNRQERTEWFSVVTWDRLAENCGQYLAKGRPVLVEGRLTTRSWEGQDGTKHYRTEVIASTVQFLGQGQGRPDAEGAVEPEDLPFD